MLDFLRWRFVREHELWVKRFSDPSLCCYKYEIVDGVTRIVPDYQEIEILISEFSEYEILELAFIDPSEDYGLIGAISSYGFDEHFVLSIPGSKWPRYQDLTANDEQTVKLWSRTLEREILRTIG